MGKSAGTSVSKLAIKQGEEVGATKSFNASLWLEMRLPTACEAMNALAFEAVGVGTLTAAMILRWQ